MRATRPVLGGSSEPPSLPPLQLRPLAPRPVAPRDATNRAIPFGSSANARWEWATVEGTMARVRPSCVAASRLPPQAASVRALPPRTEEAHKRGGAFKE